MLKHNPDMIKKVQQYASGNYSEKLVEMMELNDFDSFSKERQLQIMNAIARIIKHKEEIAPALQQEIDFFIKESRTLQNTHNVFYELIKKTLYATEDLHGKVEKLYSKMIQLEKPLVLTVPKRIIH